MKGISVIATLGALVAYASAQVSPNSIGITSPGNGSMVAVGAMVPITFLVPDFSTQGLRVQPGLASLTGPAGANLAVTNASGSSEGTTEVQRGFNLTTEMDTFTPNMAGVYVVKVAPMWFRNTTGADTTTPVTPSGITATTALVTFTATGTGGASSGSSATGSGSSGASSTGMSASASASSTKSIGSSSYGSTQVCGWIVCAFTIACSAVMLS